MVVSVGNSRTALAAFVEGELVKVARVENGDPDVLRGAVTQIWEVLKEAGAEVAGASVNTELVEPTERIIREVTSAGVSWVGSDIDLPIKVLTEQPESTGVDRVLNVAAAYEQLGKACVVVDAGTAVTVSLCDDQGSFLGGAIAPGVRLQTQALHEHTSRLPLVELARPTGDFGKSTTTAIHHGVFHGIRGLVKEVLENYASHLGQWPELIATGGDAELLFADWELTHAISPDLTLYGIALAYAEHHIKYGT